MRSGVIEATGGVGGTVILAVMGGLCRMNATQVRGCRRRIL